jgi:hypothetical protein
LCCYLLYRKANRVIRGPDVGGGIQYQKTGGKPNTNQPNIDLRGPG